RLLVEIVRLATALVDEIGGEVEMPAVAGDAVEPHQRELHLGMPAISPLLPIAGSERCADMLDVALQYVEEAAPAGGQEVGEAAFDQVAEIVELVIVAQVGPAVFRLALQVPAIEVAVGRLRLFEIVDDLLDLHLDVGVAAMRQRVRRRLDPLPD